MKKFISLLLTGALALSLAACADAGAPPEDTAPPQPAPQTESLAPAPATAGKTLIAYFTRLDNTAATPDEIVQGGGPYGPVGDSLASADVDALSSASITMLDGQVQGNVQTLAQYIAAATGGELFSIQTEQRYPVDYDTLIDQGGEERRQDVRPALSTYVEDMTAYDVVFLGFPNWWGDMPMALYSFLEEYDLSGKTVIPFVASASSGLSDTVRAISAAQPNAIVVDNGLHVRMGDVAQSEPRVREWLTELGLLTE